ncbi:TPA: hypothetical protein ACKTC7_001253 [Streptococcus pyogenes]|nr:hypothetical protein [Streptococcus pyogenes]EQL79279.1 hypothetical protein HMPREF1225_1947 [Streptococcus pyogenes UTSW-2]ESA56436.1 hypothetical protein HMPREF1238_1010 [Streptococcus pyogenes GA40377]QBX29040.1 hypothetical protein Javan478_0031 [Streptococcus phage Javan478]QBX29171.1 hypothetical protein Javan484_0037 [Streptococcus phage Javan484]QBX29881.1 hypothetical protein Javan516_0035 [Streptococcus phage Javan516]
MKDNKELMKDKKVATNRRSIIFISVPKSSIITTNLLEPEVGINEKLAKNIAVTIAENDRDADIISVKFFKLFGEILK